MLMLIPMLLMLAMALMLLPDASKAVAYVVAVDADAETQMPNFACHLASANVVLLLLLLLVVMLVMLVMI